jgi:hypothetical protein
MEETVTDEGNMEALVDYPFVESKEKTVLVISLLNTLHDLNYVGIDTCSAVSVSTEKGDFSFIDDSQAAKDSVILRGVGGENTVIGGRGPMVAQAKDSNGNNILVFDPSGVYLDQAEQDDSQARFRIFGQSRLKRAGLKIHQDKYDDGQDYLVYRGGEMEIPTETIDEIVALKTSVRELTEEQERGLIDHLQRIISEGKGGPAFVQVQQCASFITNEANLTSEQTARLIHWRQAHRQAGDGIIHENCPICEEGKRKTKGFKRNQDYREQVTKKFAPYHHGFAELSFEATLNYHLFALDLTRNELTQDVRQFLVLDLSIRFSSFLALFTSLKIFEPFKTAMSFSKKGSSKNCLPGPGFLSKNELELSRPRESLRKS